MESKKIKVEVIVEKPIEKVWQFWTIPKHITNWNFASEDWHCPKAENDLKKGGKFSFTMASKDDKISFDLGGVYDKIIENEQISYSLDDGRKVDNHFKKIEKGTKIVSIFEAEKSNPIEMQQNGWQAILDNFKKYCENQ